MSELTPWQKYKQDLGNTRPWDLVNVNTEYIDDKTASDRYMICRACPELIKLTKQCKKCGCFMNVKTKLSMATCPLGKW